MHHPLSPPSCVTRRQCHAALGALLLGAWQQAQALSLAQLSSADASSGSAISAARVAGA